MRLKIVQALEELPYRGEFGAARPPALAALSLPPYPMPSHDRGRPLKAWRYIGVFAPELMLCLGHVRIARAHQTFWAIWDRESQRLYERTVIGHGGLTLAPGFAQIADEEVQLELHLKESAGIEAICPAGRSYAWTRKQGGAHATGTIAIGHTRRARQPAARPQRLPAAVWHLLRRAARRRRPRRGVWRHGGARGLVVRPRYASLTPPSSVNVQGPGLPTERLVESPRPRQVTDAESEHGDSLAHARNLELPRSTRSDLGSPCKRSSRRDNARGVVTARQAAWAE